jgi:glycopeptide antibiotics resistance protein
MRWLLAIWTALILYLTLAPFQLRVGPSVADVPTVLVASLGRTLQAGDAIRNVLLFIPFGFALARLVTRPAVPGYAPLAIGFALSLSIESAQVFIAWRTPNLFDVLWNTSGGLIGAFVATAVTRRRISAG